MIDWFFGGWGEEEARVERVEARKVILVPNFELLRHAEIFMTKHSILMIVEKIIFIINLENLET